jgi:two-component system nitrate/nitrite response regulator NarL
MISVVLVGTNNLFLQGLRSLLDPAQFSVAGEARDLAALQARLDGGVAPDLVVADLNGSQESDLDHLRGIRANYENMRIVVLANELCLAQMARLLKAGIDGYLLNELSAKAFSLSLLLVMTGEKALPSVLAGVLADASGNASSGAADSAQKHLTEREKQILQCLLHAYSNKHIARALNISEGTVKVHLKSLMKKIAVGNRTQAALWARNHGFENGHLMGNGHIGAG